MKRILLKIEYDGTNYSGWQKQQNQKTIQGEIEESILRTIGEEVEVFGSGRTDAGVHALGQFAHFDIKAPVPVSKIANILNRALPLDIVIKEAQEVDNDFHARFSVTQKKYCYKIYNGLEKKAFLANRVGWVKYPLDLDKMEKAAKLLLGEHDFKGFCSSNTSVQNFVRTIYSIDIIRKDNFIDIEVCGSGFLYNMVRIIVGTLVDYALDKLSMENIKNALENGDRSSSGQTMPAGGLYLKEAVYD